MKTTSLFLEDCIVARLGVEAYQLPILSEAVHYKIQNILDGDHPIENKLPMIVKEARRLLATGESSGFENDKPKRGSSRAVYFPKEKREIMLDGKKASVPTAVKIAFRGTLDPHTNHTMLLGEMQNQVEADPGITGDYGIIRQTQPGNYETNPNGVLVPVFDAHPEYHHLEMGKIEKFNANDFREATKTKDFPKGIAFSHMTDTMRYIHADANSEYHWSRRTDEDHERIMHHPFVSNMINMMLDSDMHPGDLAPRNMGIWVHPHTKTRHPVIADYGATKEVLRHYVNARRNMWKKQQYSNWKNGRYGW